MFYIVKQWETVTLIRFGRIVKTVQTGIQLKMPFIDSLIRLDMRVQTFDLRGQSAITKDNISVKIDSVGFLKIEDAGKLIMGVEDYWSAIKSYSQTSLRNIVGEYSLDELLEKREVIAEKMKLIVDEAKRVPGTMVMSHVCENATAWDCLKAGVDTFEHIGYLDEGLCEEMVKQDRYLVPTVELISNFYLDFSKIDERQDKGVLYESYVFLKLKTKLKPNMEIKFWRTKDGDEVDFILVKDRKPIPIEVKGYLSRPEIPKGIKRFLLRYTTIKNVYIINKNTHDCIDLALATLEKETVSVKK